MKSVHVIHIVQDCSRQYHAEELILWSGEASSNTTHYRDRHSLSLHMCDVVIVLQMLSRCSSNVIQWSSLSSQCSYDGLWGHESPPTCKRRLRALVSSMLRSFSSSMDSCCLMANNFNSLICRQWQPVGELNSMQHLKHLAHGEIFEWSIDSRH